MNSTPEIIPDAYLFTSPVNDLDVRCPTSGTACPRMVELVRYYTEHADPTLVPPERAIEDRTLLEGLLRVAKVEGRACPRLSAACPIIEEPTALHTIAATGFWKARKLFKSRGGVK